MALVAVTSSANLARIQQNTSGSVQSGSLATARYFAVPSSVASSWGTPKTKGRGRL